MMFYPKLLFISFLYFIPISLSGRTFIPSPNQSPERPIHANEITPNLPGLSEHGRKIEKDLESLVKTGKLKPQDVGTDRMIETSWARSKAEYKRNQHHTQALRYKKDIRKNSRTYKGRFKLLDGDVYRKLEHERNEKGKSRQLLKDIAHDSAIHQKLKTFGDKDVKHINNSNWKESKELGYHSDGRSNGSSYGYRTSSPSPSTMGPWDFLTARPSRPTPSHSNGSSSSSESLPNVSSPESFSQSRSRSLQSPSRSTASSSMKRHI